MPSGSMLAARKRPDRITTEASVCHGKPVIRGLRYPVQMLLELLASGMSIEEVLADYPDLERDDLCSPGVCGVDRGWPSGRSPRRRVRVLVAAQLPARLASRLAELGHVVVHTSSLPDGNRTTDQSRSPAWPTGTVGLWSPRTRTSATATC